MSSYRQSSGATDKVARHLHPLLVAAGHTPVALVRRRTTAPSSRGSAPRSGCSTSSSSDAAAFAAAFAGCDAVVFAAGGGPDGNIERKRTVDLEGR